MNREGSPSGKTPEPALTAAAQRRAAQLQMAMSRHGRLAASINTRSIPPLASAKTLTDGVSPAD